MQNYTTNTTSKKVFNLPIDRKKISAQKEQSYIYSPLTNRARGLYWRIFVRGRGSKDRAQ